MSLRLVICSALAGAAVMGVSPEAVARGSRRDVAGYELVKLESIRSNPSAYIGKRVSFDCFFAALGKIYQPFQTPFVPEQFLNVHVWEPGTQLWDNRERKKAFLFCYIPRDLEKLVDYVMRLETYETVRFFGRVSVVYSKHPWFEIEDVESSAMPKFTENALKHILVGIKSIRNEDFTMAKESFKEASATGLPEDAQIFVQRELGRAYYQLEEYEGAARSLAVAAKIVGDDSWVLLRWGQSLSRVADTATSGRLNTLKQAQDKLERARKREPANPEVHAEIGWVIAKIGNPGGGILHVKRAIALRQTAPSYRILGRIYLDLKPVKYADAENAYQRAIMLDPSNPQYHRELAAIYMSQQRYREAEAEFTNVVTLTSSETRGYIERAEARRKRGNREGAKADFNMALNQDAENLDALLGLATVHIDAKEYDEARKSLQTAQALQPQSIEVRIMLGKIHMAQGSYEKAVTVLQELLVAMKKNKAADLTEVYFNLGVAKMKQAKPDISARADFDMALRITPSHLGALKHRASVYADTGKHAMAVRDLNAAKDLAPRDEVLRLQLADALAESNQVNTAIDELAALMVEKPESAWAKNNRAFLIAEFKAGQADEAVALAQEAYATDESNSQFVDTLAWSKFKNGARDEARDLLEAAVLTAKGPYPFYHLAAVLVETDREAAAANIKEAVKRMDKLPTRGFVTDKVKADIRKLGGSLGIR